MVKARGGKVRCPIAFHLQSGSRGGRMLGFSSLSPISFYSWCSPHSEWVLSSQINLSGNPYPAVSLPGNSKSRHLDNEGEPSLGLEKRRGCVLSWGSVMRSLGLASPFLHLLAVRSGVGHRMPGNLGLFVCQRRVCSHGQDG